MGPGSGVIEPMGFEIVRGVFKRVAAHASFKDDIPTLNCFGLIVLHAYQHGITDGDQLYDHCLAASKAMPTVEHPL